MKNVSTAMTGDGSPSVSSGAQTMTVTLETADTIVPKNLGKPKCTHDLETCPVHKGEHPRPLAIVLSCIAKEVVLR
jgi:hypothetical protein